MHCSSGLRSFRSHNRVISIHRTNLLNKFLVRSEIISYTWNEMTMKGNNQIPYKPQQALFIVKVNIVIHCRNLLRQMDGLFKKKLRSERFPFLAVATSHAHYYSCAKSEIHKTPSAAPSTGLYLEIGLIYPLGKRMMFLWKSYIFMYSHVSGLSAS